MVRLLATLICTVGMLVPFSVSGQSCGDETIARARKSYAVGHFQPALKSLNYCLAAEDGFSESRELISANRWLAKIYIAMDSMDLALNCVYNILEQDKTYKPPAEDPLLLHNLVEYARNSRSGATISSVSKIAESLYETPATVIVLSQEELMNRGYVDLEAFFADLPRV